MGSFLATFEEMNAEKKDYLYALFASRKMDGAVESFGNDEVLGMLKSVKRKDIIYVFNAKKFGVVFSHLCRLKNEGGNLRRKKK